MGLRRARGLKRWLLALFLAGLLLGGLPLAAAHATALHHQPIQVLAHHRDRTRHMQPGCPAATTVRGAVGMAWGAGGRATRAPTLLEVSLLSPPQPRAPPPRVVDAVVTLVLASIIRKPAHAAGVLSRRGLRGAPRVSPTKNPPSRPRARDASAITWGALEGVYYVDI